MSLQIGLIKEGHNAISRIMPEIDRTEIELKFLCIVGMLHHILMTDQKISTKHSKLEDYDLLKEHLIAYSVAIFKAK